MSKISIVIPTIGKNEMIVNLLRQITSTRDDISKRTYVFDNGMPESVKLKCAEFAVEVIDSHEDKIYSMWNKGVVKSLLDEDIEYICIFNDDILLFDLDNWFHNFLMPFHLDEDIWGVCGNYDYSSPSEYLYKNVTGTYKDRGFAGFCFAVPANAYNNGLPFFDERFNWWYGDDDFVHSVHSLGKKTAMSLNAGISHINGGSQSVVQYTEEFNDKTSKDHNLYISKWHSQ